MSATPKGILIGVLATLFLVILFQNTHVVSIRFLFWRVSMSQIILIPIILFAGIAIGYFLGKRSW